jgi:SAM-dependent methyltransferase
VSRSPDHVRKNRRDWDATSDEYQREHARQLNRWSRPAWGVWGIPESRLQVLGDVRGQRVLEYGCGGGQWSITLAKMGGRPVGLDLSGRQLDHARRLMSRSGVRFPLVQANGERTPFADERFDLVMCDHGAMTFTDPFRSVPEVARILRPGGAFVFNIASPFQFMCWDDERETVGERLNLSYFGMHRWEDAEGVSFSLPFGEWIRLFHANQLEIEDLVEPRPSARAGTTYPTYAPLAWARRFPAESIWKLRKRDPSRT